ncbi:unnamed protein product [Paramecium sonneborni]|uniref:Uncharacterized protein n=1 Tax=Paramecium sonneborni TaxID=65129 RepID=A0A8S1R6K1_9CILI|nr:unnamed protein product [Paramecium sonneborni]
MQESNQTIINDLRDYILLRQYMLKQKIFIMKNKLINVFRIEKRLFAQIINPIDLFKVQGDIKKNQNQGLLIKNLILKRIKIRCSNKLLIIFDFLIQQIYQEIRICFQQILLKDYQVYDVKGAATFLFMIFSSSVYLCLDISINRKELCHNGIQKQQKHSQIIIFN